MTPEEFIEQHELTIELKRRGVTSAQLSEFRLLGINSGHPFDSWPFTCPADTPMGAISLAKSFSALRWLVLDNPPTSRDIDDAWVLVGEVLKSLQDVRIAPDIAIGQKHRKTQSSNAKNRRGKLETADESEALTIDDVIRDLATRPEYLGEKAKGLWRILYSRLDELRLDPREVEHADLEKSYYEYDFKGRRKPIRFGSFKTRVSTYRTKKKSQ